MRASGGIGVLARLIDHDEPIVHQTALYLVANLAVVGGAGMTVTVHVAQGTTVLAAVLEPARSYQGFRLEWTASWHGAQNNPVEAAKEIKGLITQSTVQVGSGVKLVTETGQALDRIVAHVAQI